MRIQYPKTLYKIDNTTILDYQLNIISKYYKPYIVTGYCEDLIKQHLKQTNQEAKLLYNIDYHFNVAGSIIQAAKSINCDYLTVVYGDLLFTKKCLLRAITNPLSCIISSPHMRQDEVGFLYDGVTEHTLNHMSFGLSVKWGQIASFTGKELEILRSLGKTENYRLFGYELINKIINLGGKFVVSYGLSYDIDTKKDVKILMESSCKRWYFK